MGAGQGWGGSQWEGGLGWRGCIRHNCGKRFARLGDTIGEERGLRASLRSRPGVSARDPRGGVCENNRREADSRFNAGQKTGHYCPENICPMHKYPTLRAFMPAVYTLIIHWCEINMKHVILYVGHMYKPFWTKKIWLGRQEGPGKVKIWHIWVISMGNVHKCIILTFPDPPCQPGQIFLVQNGLYMCPTYSTTCFMSNSHLWGVF